MLFYKLRPLSNLNYILDILVNERLYCATYDQLNDPFEGQFFAITHPKNAKEGIIPREVEASINDFWNPNTPELRICSLTGASGLKDVRMWSFYAGNHNGVAIEIDTDELDGYPLDVTYRNNIPRLDPELLNNGSKNPAYLYASKTRDWEYENESRVILREPYFSVKGAIKRVLFGIRVTDDSLNLLRKIVPNNIQFARMRLDYQNASIVEDDAQVPITVDSAVENGIGHLES